MQGVISRGDRRIGEALLKACEMGGSKAFKKALKEMGINAEEYLYRKRQEDELFPWERLDMGFRRELKRAEELKPTLPCFDNCHRCGVC